MKKVIALVGGISQNALNKQLLGFVKARARGRFAFDAPALEALPFFSQDLEDDPPAPVAAFRDAVAAADAVLVVTPEYNRSYPGVLKNALDWASRPDSLWAGKPAGIIGASGGSIGTFGAQQHLRNVMSFLGMDTMGQPEFYFAAPQRVDGQGNLLPDAAKFLDQWLEAYTQWVSVPDSPSRGA